MQKYKGIKKHIKNNASPVEKKQKINTRTQPARQPENTRMNDMVIATLKLKHEKELKIREQNTRVQTINEMKTFLNTISADINNMHSINASADEYLMSCITDQRSDQQLDEKLAFMKYNSHDSMSTEELLQRNFYNRISDGLNNMLSRANKKQTHSRTDTYAELDDHQGIDL